MADPIAPTPILTGEDARLFIEAAQNPLKAPDVEIDSEKLDAILGSLMDEATDEGQE